MSDKQKSAELILKLYELRREEVMREARDWFATFNPSSADEVFDAARGEHSAYYRMVTSYWEMACSFVNHGAIDEEMFNDANGEQAFVFAKLHPFLEELRARTHPQALRHLEQAVMRLPEAEKRLERMREMSKMVAAARASAATEQAEADAANA
ncbi:MAG TPA: hypothetical protein VFS10_06095 [Pyrinomonadaceae bacterium]|nr:hypothetical protein [Pyrinomonadaceae bacterium]